MKIEIITPGADIDALCVPWERHAKPLLKAGARFYEYQPARFHANICLSMTAGLPLARPFDNRSMSLNEEA